jgi:hypothetical protein
MASINASTSGAGGVITTADNTGTLQLQSGGTTIATITSTGITTQVGAPAFSAYLSGNQTLTTQTFQKITCQTEEFDTASCYDNSTNYRFTPNVAGYYQVTATIYFNNDTRGIVAIYKNGSVFKFGNDITTTGLRPSNMSCLVYLNGSTDYIELYGFTQGTTIVGGQNYQTYFQAVLVRSA